LLAATRQVGTAAFLISVADAAGYATTMLLYLVRLLWHDQISWARLTILMSFALAVLCPLLLLASWLSLRRHRHAS
jgi:hypothetical protein